MPKRNYNAKIYKDFNAAASGVMTAAVRGECSKAKRLEKAFRKLARKMAFHDPEESRENLSAVRRTVTGRCK